MPDTPPPERLTQAAFARLLGVDPAHITRLKQDGRLVMDGRFVCVAESQARIEATRGQRDDVADRHAASRSQGAKRTRNVQTSAQDSTNKPDDFTTLEGAARIAKFAKAREGLAQAQIREMERDKLAGRLLAREDVEQALTDVGALVRAELDALPDQLAPQLAAPMSADEVHTLLTAHCRNILIRLADTLRKKAAAHTTAP
jgi:phage terminase Nu1 subunit (DNA packaging protein)